MLNSIVFSQHALDVMKQRGIFEEWIVKTLQDIEKPIDISEAEQHFFRNIEEADGRCLKVVFNPATLTVVTAYFDRNARKRGCQ